MNPKFPVDPRPVPETGLRAPRKVPNCPAWAPKETAKSTRAHRVVIVDEHPMVAEWIGRVMGSEGSLKVCGRADTLEAALEIIAKVDPHIIITELALPDRHGVDVVRIIKSRFAQVPLLVFSARPEAMCAEATIKAGAHGYISKRESGTTLIRGIQTALGGEVFVSPKVTEAMLQTLKGSPPRQVFGSRAAQPARVAAFPAGGPGPQAQGNCAGT